jgi:hypothetical protein
LANIENVLPSPTFNLKLEANKNVSEVQKETISIQKSPAVKRSNQNHYNKLLEDSSEFDSQKPTPKKLFEFKPFHKLSANKHSKKN